MSNLDGAITDLALDLLRRALAGQPEALRQLVDAASPIVRARVVWALRRARVEQTPRETRREIEDLSLEVFIALFQDGAKVLRQWDAAHGLPLATFIGLVATRAVITILRGGQRIEREEPPLIWSDVEQLIDGAIDSSDNSPEQRTLEEILDRLYATLTPSALGFFHRAHVLQQTPDEMCSALALRPEAIYARRSRLQRTINRLLEELAAEADAERERRRRLSKGRAR